MGRARKTIAARRWSRLTSRIGFGSIANREESRTVRRRAHAVIGSFILATLVLAAVVAVILVDDADGLISHAAEQRAQHGLALLVTVGADMPDLTPAVMQNGLSPASDAQLDAAVRRGQRAGLLSSLTVWNARGRPIYSVDGGGLTWLKSQAERSELASVLHGHLITVTDPSELDLASHKRTGTLQAFEPLRDGRGRVYGVIDVELPLEPILDQTEQERRDILIFVIGGSLALLLLALPFMPRAGLAIARSWAPGRRRLLRDFERALDAGAIELVYQPQVDPADESVYGVEALVRWRRDGKLLTPDRFLAAIESSPLMTDLTHRIIDLATAQLGAWREAGHAPHVSINLSATDLADDTLAARIDEALTHQAIPSDQLTVEVTETAILHDVVRATRLLNAIRELGVQIAIDDFGTGHASISRLHQFPIDEVKIDRSFVTPTDERTRSYLTAIVHFLQDLNLRIVAEGVEDGATLRYLKELGCDVAQGYHIAKPLPASQLHDWLPNATGFRVASIVTEHSAAQPTR